MANLKNVIYLSNEDYNTLATTGTVTIGSETLVYDENNLYITPDGLASATEDGLMSSSDKVKLDGIDLSKYLPLTGGVMSGSITLPNDTNSYNSKGILFSGGSRIGESSASANTLGIYSPTNIYFGTGSSSTYASNRIYLSGNTFCPEITNNMTLGTSANRWLDIYASNSLYIHNSEGTGVQYTRDRKINLISAGATQYTLTLPGQTGTLATTSDIKNGGLTIKVEGTALGTFYANDNNNYTWNITAASLGLTGAIKFLGITTTNISDGSTTRTITINGVSVTADTGNVVIKDGGSQEFLWTSDHWEQLGDEISYALKNVTITGDGVLQGGGSLEANRTITHKTVLGTAQGTAGIYKTTFDAYGHVASAVAAAGSDLVTVAGNTHKILTSSEYSNLAKLNDYNIFTSTIYFNTNTNTTPVTIRRGNSDEESIKIGVDDSSVTFNYTNDEKASSILFYLNNTDTENSDGSDASSHYVRFISNKDNIRISLDGTAIADKTTLYENGTALSSKYLGINDPANRVKMHGRITSANINVANSTGLMQVDLATGVMTTGKPESDGFIQTFFWDDPSSGHTNSWTGQLYIPNNSSYHPSIRSYDPSHSTWSDWKKLAYTSDIPANFADINNRYDTLLNFSVDAPSIRTGVSPIGMSLSLARSACRTDFINGNAITIERSDDGGSTWTTVDYSASEKRALFTTNIGLQLYNGNSGDATLNSQCRVTLTAQDGTAGESHRYLYTNPRKMLINYSSPHSGKVLIEKRTGANYQSDGAWVTVGTYYIGGWSSWNEIPLVMDTLGGSVSQTGNYWQLRLTFSFTSISSSYPTYRHSATNILIFGDNDWGRASAVAGFGPISGTGHLYSYDVNANATFPAMVGATTFIEDGSSLSNKYLGLNSLAVGLKSHTPSRTSSDINTMHNGFNLYFIDSTNKAISPSNNDGLLLEWSWPGNTNYGVQFFVDESVEDSIYFRQEYSQGNWRNWIHMASREWVNNQSFATKTYVDDAIAAAITTALNSSY